jgi:hypothetical protein
MRRALSPPILVGALFVFGEGCTFLVSFDDVAPDDASTPIEAPVRPPPERDTGAPEPELDSGDASPKVPTTPACDTSFPLAQVKGCATFVQDGQICADSPAITEYPGDRTRDVVTCSKAGATCVRHCVACAHLPSGFPDQCDQCMGKPNGTYCGTDMGWQPDNFRLLVTCKNERMATATACSASGCDSKGGTGSAACKP